MGTAEKNIKEKITLENMIMVGIFIIVSIALFWKCKYGYGHGDEAFYPTIAKRFLDGDRILYDEWNTVQLSAVVIMPFLRLYTLFNGSYDGVYLYFRYAYTVIKILISILIYIRLKRYGKQSAYISAIAFLVYAGWGMMVVAYKTISLGGATVAFVLMLNEKDCIKTRVYWVLAGIALAVGVLGNPFNVFIYVAYVIAVIVLSALYKNALKKGKKVNETIKLCYSYKALGFVTIGAAASAIAFFAYVFSKTTLSQLIQTIPQMVLRASASAYQVRNLYDMTFGYVLMWVKANGNVMAVSVPAVLVGVVIAYLCDRKKQQRFPQYIIVFSAVAIVLLAIYKFTIEYKMNGIVYLLNVIAFLLFVMVRNDEIKELFAGIAVPGVVVTWAEYLASNQGFRATSSASCVSAVGSVMIIVLVVQGYLLNEEARAKYGKWAKAAGSALMLFLTLNIFLLMYYRFTFVQAEPEGISSLTAKIETGVSKGLVVTQEEYDNYMKIYSDTESIRSMPNDTKVVYMGDHILWMAGSQRAATCSVWRNSNIGDRKLFLYVYYDERPDMIADVIYVEEKYGYELVEELVERYGYSAVKKSAGWILSIND
jgi:hypothetical protein